MEEIFAIVLQVLIEVGIQFFGGIGIDLAATSGKGEGDRDQDGCGWLAIFGVFGAICGGLSLLVMPNALLPNFPLRLANLVISPFLAGGLSYLIAANVWSRDRRDPRHHFWRGFCFALLFAIVRFAYVHR